MDERRKRGWPFWFWRAVIALPFAYLASFGPACWIASRACHGVESTLVSSVYQPVLMARDMPGTLGALVIWYSVVGASDNWYITHNTAERRYVWMQTGGRPSRPTLLEALRR